MTQERSTGPSPERSVLQLGVGLLICILLMALPAPGQGLWNRSYLAHLPMPTAAAWQAPAEPPATPLVMEPGIGCYLETVCPTPEVPRALAHLDDLSLDWARTEIPWAGIEPQRGRFSWQRWDGVVDGLRARHYRILGMLCYWTPWVEPYSDTAIDEFGRYAERVARRYRGRVAAWEIWNEPNERTYWSSTPERYARLMRAAYEGVKRGDPDAVVVGGSLSGVDLVYLRTLLKLGAGSWMDYLSVHPYSFGWSPEDALLLQELRGIAREMRRAGKSDRLWVTEIGINLPAGKKQAMLLQRTWALLQQSGVVDKAFWFNLYHPGSRSYPLYREDWSPNPSAVALKQVVEQLRGAVPAGSAVPADLQPPWASGAPFSLSGPQAWWYRKGTDHVLAVWGPDGEVEYSGPGTGGQATMTGQPSWKIYPGDLQ